MRFIQAAQASKPWAANVCFYEVDADGQPATLVETQPVFSPVGPRTDEPPLGMYWCSVCHYASHSWDEAKLHIINLDQQEK
jgi:hypothetical protein